MIQRLDHSDVLWSQLGGGKLLHDSHTSSSKVIDLHTAPTHKHGRTRFQHEREAKKNKTKSRRTKKKKEKKKEKGNNFSFFGWVAVFFFSAWKNMYISSDFETRF